MTCNQTNIMSNTIVTASTVGRPSAIQTILTAGLIAGCLDLLTAIIVYSVVMQRTTDIKLLQGIGRAAFGSDTFQSGSSLALAGVAVHFFIAFSFTVFYFFIFPYITFFRRQPVIAGLLYGIFAWCVMNLIMLPLFHVANIPHKWDSIIRGAVILMFCIGLPISLIVSWYYRGKATQ
jgi:uncharacterized membrane protein YagU involved in acid resistance